MTSNGLKYGDVVKIVNSARTTNKYMAACGRVGTGCGLNVSMRLDSNTAAGGVDLNWRVLGGKTGTYVKVGDYIILQNLYNELYMSPCGRGNCNHINMSLRPLGNIPSIDFLKWKVETPTLTTFSTGQIVTYGKKISFKSHPLNVAEHGDRYIDTCGSYGGCGENVSFRETPYQPVWHFERSVENFVGEPLVIQNIRMENVEQMINWRF